MTNINKLIPNTINFFKAGLTFENCFANSEWTLPSVASLFTGKYTHKSKIFHPRYIKAFDSNDGQLKWGRTWATDDFYLLSETNIIFYGTFSENSEKFSASYDISIYSTIVASKLETGKTINHYSDIIEEEINLEKDNTLAKMYLLTPK